MLSTRRAILPSNIWAAVTSGLSVYLTLGSGLYQVFLLMHSIKLWSPKVNASTSISANCFFTVSNASGLVLSSIKAIATSVLDSLPTETISNLSFGSLILLLISALLNTIVSTKPSLAPRKTFSLSGSSGPLAG